MSALYMQYLRDGKGVTFAAFLKSIGFGDPSVDVNGMDDKVLAQPAAAGGLELIAVPRQSIEGELRIIVLLVDFPDRPGQRSVAHYEDLLFSKGVHPTGSLRDYYAEVSNGKVDIVGSVHGWLRMPRKYTSYLGTDSGMEPNDYPDNCQKLGEDAAAAALAKGVKFPPDLDKLGRQFVTALFIVHSGAGAESFPTVETQRQEIWSHKWNLVKPVKVAPGLSATTYLMVPQNCKLGVCAHELGHLAFQWQDFYDPNYNEDGKYWNGTGNWDLMASGSYNFGEAKPAHPAALHKLQHGWVQALEVSKSTSVQLKPTTAAGGRVCKIVSPQFAKSQFLLLESRPQKGFDKFLPGEGLLVWRVDLSKEMYAPATPGMQLVQADGRSELEKNDPNYQGDDSDPFPGSEDVTRLEDINDPSTSFPGKRSGVTLRNIRFDSKGVASFDVTIEAVTAPAKKAAANTVPAKKTAAKKTAAKNAIPKALKLATRLASKATKKPPL